LGKSKAKPKAKAKASQRKDLEKSKAVGLDKPTAKPKVMVDWHQTLENSGRVSSEDLFALEQLLGKS
jgi:hypothetical protein